MESRGRGRSRGRASRGAQPPPGQGFPQRPGGPPQTAPGGGGGRQPQQAAGRPPAPGPQGAWAPRAPQPQAPQTGAWARPAGPPAAAAGPAPSSGPGQQFPGRAGAGEPGITAPPGGAAGGPDAGVRGRQGGNGGVRGRTANRHEIMVTKPQHVQSKKGSSGQVVNLTANYFQVLQAGKWCLYQYRADFAPEIDSTPRRRGLVRRGVREHLPGGYLFDGTVMFIAQRINPDPLEVFVQEENGENIRITIRYVGDLAWGDHNYLQLFNILVRKCLRYLKLELLGRNYFDPHAKIDMVEHKLELWPGYYTSMRQHERDILLNTEVTFKVLRIDNVYELLLECQTQNYRAEFCQKIVGRIVLTYYNNKTYKVDDVDFDSNPNSTFTRRDGSQISYAEYFKQKYNVNIRDLNQPMLVSRSKPREIRAGMPETVVLVPELCQLTGLSDKQRENFQLMRQMATHTRLGPQERVQKLLEFSQRMRGCPEAVEELRRWDLTLANNLINFQGRVLPPENILGGDNQKYSAGDFADWTRSMRGKPMLLPGQLQRMAVICPGRLSKEVQNFVQCMQKAANGMSWSIGNPRIYDIPDDKSNTYLEHLERIISNDNPNLIMCVLMSAGIDRYSAIKKKCCVDRPIPTQVITGRILKNKDLMSIATKVCIQLNCKIGGAPWSVGMPLSNLMVVGYDVCRDVANKKKSFGAMVASLDKQITRYFSFSSEHSMEEELSNNFAAFLCIACEKFKEVNGRYPERILIYRDGVGDGQLPYVYEHEVDTIKKKLSESIYKNNDLKMAFVIVSKRINARIFSNGQNPKPGTVVDDVITLPQRYDFFIASQCVRQGTVAPTSYNVLEDTMGLPPDRLQILTYKLTHMYFNLSGTVRVPAPCQYAHKLAFLVAQSLHRPAHRQLEKVLYFL